MRKEKQTRWLVLYILLVAAFGVMLGVASRPAAKALGTVNAPVVVQEKHIAPKTVGTLAAVEIKECQQANAEEKDRKAPRKRRKEPILVLLRSHIIAHIDAATVNGLA